MSKPGHKSEFPKIKSAQEYQNAAKDFFKKPPEGTLTGVRKGKGWGKQEGDIVCYHETSNTFGIMSEGRAIRTMYKPDVTKHGFKTNKDYFYDTIQFRPASK